MGKLLLNKLKARQIPDLPEKREVVKPLIITDAEEEKVKKIHQVKKEKPIRLTVDVSPEMYQQIKIKMLQSERPTATIRQYFVALAQADLNLQP